MAATHKDLGACSKAMDWTTIATAGKRLPLPATNLKEPTLFNKSKICLAFASAPSVRQILLMKPYSQISKFDKDCRGGRHKILKLIDISCRLSRLRDRKLQAVAHHGEVYGKATGKKCSALASSLKVHSPSLQVAFIVLLLPCCSQYSLPLF